MPTGSERRRSFLSIFVNEAPQRQFILMQFFVLVSMMFFLMYVVYELHHQIEITTQGFTTVAEELRLQLENLYSTFFYRMILIFFLGFLANILIGFMFLHTILGPLVQVRNVLGQLAEGRLPDHEIRFRTGDLATEIADGLNRVIEHLRRNRSAS